MRKAVILHKGENRSEGEVINIIECTEQGVMGLTLPEEQSLWDCTQHAVSLGDLFKDGVFYHQSEPVKRIPTLEEKLACLPSPALPLPSPTYKKRAGPQARPLVTWFPGATS